MKSFCLVVLLFSIVSQLSEGLSSISEVLNAMQPAAAEGIKPSQQLSPKALVTPKKANENVTGAKDKQGPPSGGVPKHPTGRMALPAVKSITEMVSRFGPLNLIAFGAPGVGKGTYSGFITREWGIPHISTGDIIRDEISRNTKRGQMFKEYSAKGKLVPDEVITEIVKDRLKNPDTKNGYILDGYPRSMAQAVAMEKFSNPSLVINFFMPEKLIIRKLLGRRLCKNCKATYNVATVDEDGVFIPPLLPRDGVCECGCSELVHRKDDREEVVHDRMVVYKETTAPLVEYFTRKGILRSHGCTGGIEQCKTIFKMIEDSLIDIAATKAKSAGGGNQEKAGASGSAAAKPHVVEAAAATAAAAA